ncbi:hypothetical protein Nepgr_018927 [Nepenthes gracilis]|uniref:Uncharacterized protein n=1 Tax=Nepenthes gracilis TaxID=150966 RepID=A0AAD3XUT5_NEPGR|nr:hypothetical protein Nepgr_018927 [Nepenthes gracilis]
MVVLGGERLSLRVHLGASASDSYFSEPPEPNPGAHISTHYRANFHQTPRCVPLLGGVKPQRKAKASFSRPKWKTDLQALRLPFLSPWRRSGSDPAPKLLSLASISPFLSSSSLLLHVHLPLWSLLVAPDDGRGGFCFVGVICDVGETEKRRKIWNFQQNLSLIFPGVWSN